MLDQTISDDVLAMRVAALLDQALSSLMRDETGARVYPIEEAAARLNMSATTLEQWCRDRVVDHTKLGRRRGLTAAQIDRISASNELKSTGSRPVRPGDDLAAARKASAKAASRKPQRNVA